MTLNHPDSQLLAALLDLGRADVPATAIRLAARLDRSPDGVRADLRRLDADGYADASRCRLTFLGLAVAADAIRQLQAVPASLAARRAA